MDGNYCFSMDGSYCFSVMRWKIKIIYPNVMGENLLGGVVIAYLKTFTVNSITEMIVAIISLFMIQCACLKAGKLVCFHC